MAPSNPLAHLPSAIRNRRNIRSAVVRFLAAAHPRVRLPQDKLARASRIPRDRLLAKSLEQLANVNPVIGQGALTRTALLVHPLTEAHDERRTENSALDHRVLDQSRILQVLQKQASAVQYLRTQRMAEVRTSAASPEVAIESLKSRLDWTADRNARSICPIDEVLCRSDMSAVRDRRNRPGPMLARTL